MTFEPLKHLDSGGGCTLEDYKFLYGLVSMIGPKRIVEIGTNYGLSAIAMAMALRDRKSKKARIVSFDINANAQEVARRQLEQLDLLKYVTLIHGDSSIVDPHGPFDLAFIDGDHAYEWCMRDFDNIKNHATYIVMHDSQGHDGVIKAVETIVATNEYDVFKLDVKTMGRQWSLNAVVCDAYSGFSLIRAKRKESN